MIRFCFRATFWISLFVYLLPGLMGDDTPKAGDHPVAALEDGDLQGKIVQGLDKVCTTSPELCAHSEKLAQSIGKFALSTALSSTLSLAPAPASSKSQEDL